MQFHIFTYNMKNHLLNVYIFIKTQFTEKNQNITVIALRVYRILFVSSLFRMLFLTINCLFPFFKFVTILIKETENLECVQKIHFQS